MLDNYEQAKAFHQVFDPVTQTTPHPLNQTETTHRMGFKAEEMVEFLYATAKGDAGVFEQLVADLHVNIDRAKEKMIMKQELEAQNVTEDQLLVGQVDAMLDLLYFINGTFVRMGVDPRPLSEIVHQANMGKVFPDGSPHYDEHTGKVLKPENWEEDYAPEGKLHRELIRQKNKRV